MGWSQEHGYPMVSPYIPHVGDGALHTGYHHHHQYRYQKGLITDYPSESLPYYMFVYPNVSIPESTDIQGPSGKW